MHRGALKTGQEADGLPRLVATRGVNRVVGELVGAAGHMQPAVPTLHVDPCVILMQHLDVDQGALDGSLEGMQILSAALDQTGQRALADLDARQVCHHVRRSRPGHELLLNQEDGPGTQTGAVLQRRRHFWQERCCGDLLTGRTRLLFCLTLLHEQTGRWSIHHLTSCDLQGLHRSQILLAMLTSAHPMHHHLIGAGMPLQVRARMPLPATWLLPTRGAQTPGLSHKAIRGRRHMTVVVLFSLSFFQGVEALLHLRDQLVSLGQLLPQVCLLLAPFKHALFQGHPHPIFSRLGHSLAHLPET